MSDPVLSIILCTHNPDRERLRRVLTALSGQTLPSTAWELLLIDNASHPPVSSADCTPDKPATSRTAASPFPFRILVEPTPGLTAARMRGIRESKGEFLVLVDDDNLLAPDYLEQTLAAFSRLPRVGALGGKSVPEFPAPLPANDWRREFFPLLALRDLGGVEQISPGLRPPGSTRNVYPLCAPIGAGMALRREPIRAWLDQKAPTALTDRRGTELTSSGDNDIVFSVLKNGWEVAYIPALSLTHLIPASRLTAPYLARLNHGIQKSWTQLLAFHEASPWPPIPRWTLPFRKLKARLTYRAWRSSAAAVRWSGACGHFEGRANPLPRA